MTTPPALADFPTFPQRNTADGTAYSTAARLWGTAMPAFVESLRTQAAWMALQGTLLASSFSLPHMTTYTFDASTGAGDRGAGKLGFTAGYGALIADAVDNLGADATARLARMSTTSAVKGTLMVYKVGDPTARVIADVTSVAATGGAAGFYTFTLANVQTNGAALAGNDAIVLVLAPKGDKGDTGGVGPTAQWTTDGTYPISGTPSLITIPLPTGAATCRLRLEDLGFTSSTQMVMTMSVNGGSTFGFGATMAGNGSGSIFAGFVLLEGLGRDFVSIVDGLQAGVSVPASPNLASTFVPRASFAKLATPATHVQFFGSATLNGGKIIAEKK